MSQESSILKFLINNTFILLSACVGLLSHIQLLVTLWTVACQAPISMEFSRKEYWSGLPFPSPGDLPQSGIKSTSLVSPALAGGLLIIVPLGLRQRSKCITFSTDGFSKYLKTAAV